MELNQDIPHSTLAKRVQAIIIDGVILSLTFIGLAVLLSSFESVSGLLKVLLVLLVLVLYEPILIWRTGSTLGQRWRGIRVRKLIHDERLNFGASVLRYFIKLILGSISLFFIMGTKDRQALHDLTVGSCVVVIDPSKSPNDIWFAEKNVEEPQFLYPSKTRRVIFIVFYILAVSLLFSIVDDLMVSGKCSEKFSNCESWERMIMGLTGLGAFLVCCCVVYLGWRGQLVGIKRKSKSEIQNLS
jgi:uncharacterized RDD family membrane protein YckC